MIPHSKAKRKVRPALRRKITRNLKTVTPRVFFGWRHALRFTTDKHMSTRNGIPCADWGTAKKQGPNLFWSIEHNSLSVLFHRQSRAHDELVKKSQL